MVLRWFKFFSGVLEHVNFKRQVTALLGSYRHHLLTHKRDGLGEGFGMVWGWFWMVLRKFKIVFLVFWDVFGTCSEQCSKTHSL